MSASEMWYYRRIWKIPRRRKIKNQVLPQLIKPGRDLLMDIIKNTKFFGYFIRKTKYHFLQIIKKKKKKTNYNDGSNKRKKETKKKLTFAPQ